MEMGIKETRGRDPTDRRRTFTRIRVVGVRSSSMAGRGVMGMVRRVLNRRGGHRRDSILLKMIRMGMKMPAGLRNTPMIRVNGTTMQNRRIVASVSIVTRRDRMRTSPRPGNSLATKGPVVTETLTGSMGISPGIRDYGKERSRHRNAPTATEAPGVTEG
jgi:hypothetical protein